MFIHIELTNNCNTNCVFCPREKILDTGYIEKSTFEKIIERVKEFQRRHPNEPEKVNICGLGEPFLHPDIVDFISMLTKNKLFSSIASNGFLVNKEKSKKLIKSGLKEMFYSVSGIDELYSKIHKLDFNVVKDNILSFKKYAKNKCSVWILITKCEYNKSSIEELKNYWISQGIHKIVVWEENNRGGSYDNRKSLLAGDAFLDEAVILLKNRNIRPICFTPFFDVFIGWNGLYYMCCNDFEKKFPLGSVFEYSIEEMHEIKRKKYEKGLSICKKCDNDPVNLVRAILLKIESKEVSSLDIEPLLDHLKNDSLIIYGNY